jgi:hypothetical protein
MVTFFLLLGGLIGYGIASSGHDRHVDRLKRIAENQGKHRLSAPDA